MTDPPKPMLHRKRPADGNFAEPEPAPDYWTDERLKKARPIGFPEEPDKPPPAETDDDDAGAGAGKQLP